MFSHVDEIHSSLCDPFLELKWQAIKWNAPLPWVNLDKKKKDFSTLHDVVNMWNNGRTELNIDNKGLVICRYFNAAIFDLFYL